jgi:hypothetical protein
MVFFSTQRISRTEKKPRGATLRPDAPVQPAFTFPMTAILTIRSGK